MIEQLGCGLSAAEVAADAGVAAAAEVVVADTAADDDDGGGGVAGVVRSNTAAGCRDCEGNGGVLGVVAAVAGGVGDRRRKSG